MIIRSTLFLSLLILFCTYASAQTYTISGRVIDNNQLPLPFSSLHFSSDSSKWKQTSTDENGKFIIAIEKGKYKMLIKQLGSTVYTNEVLISADTAMGDIVVDNTRSLKEITVNGNKKLLEQKIDRTIFNLENSVASQGMDAVEALSNTPLLKVDENAGISIIGKNGVSVMINDRLLNISGSDLMNYLKSIRSENISRIEVITTPPAKYDAQGNSGLVNIVLKRNPNIGFNGSLSSTLSQRTKTGFNNNLNLNYQKDKVNLSANFRQSSFPTNSEGNSDIIGQSSFLMDYSGITKSRSYGATIGLNYKISKRSLVGFSFDYNHNKSNRDVISELKYLTINRLDSALRTISGQQSRTSTVMANAFYDLELGKSGEKMSVTGNYFSTDPNTDVLFRTNNKSSLAVNEVFTTNNVNYRIGSIQTDFTLPGKWASSETGLKFTNFSNRSEISYFDRINSLDIRDISKSNDFDYDEQNYAIYLSATKTISAKWSAKLGLRYEYSVIKGFSPTLFQQFKNQYGNIFPTAYLSYVVDKSNTFSLSFSRRINRPNFSFLNPFRNYSGPYSYSVGNPALSPSYSNNIDLNYTFRNKLMISVYGSQWRNGNAFISTLENGFQINRQENYINQQTLGATFYYSQNFLGFWDTTASGNLGYSISTTSLANTIPQDGYSLTLSSYNTFSLNKAKTISMMMNYTHFFGNRSGNIENFARENLTGGIKASFLQRKLQLNLTVTDIFRQEYSSARTFYDGYEQFFRNYVDARRLNISVSYSFGSNKIKGANTTVKFDEKNRAN